MLRIFRIITIVFVSSVAPILAYGAECPSLKAGVYKCTDSSRKTHAVRLEVAKIGDENVIIYDIPGLITGDTLCTDTPKESVVCSLEQRLDDSAEAKKCREKFSDGIMVVKRSGLVNENGIRSHARVEFHSILDANVYFASDINFVLLLKKRNALELEINGRAGNAKIDFQANCRL